MVRLGGLGAAPFTEGEEVSAAQSGRPVGASVKASAAVDPPSGDAVFIMTAQRPFP